MSESASVAKPLAVLIDADNASAAVIAAVLTEVATYGTASVKRIYGDWTSNQLKSWKDQLLEYSIQPIQQFSYTFGKNSTDSAMIIDAMDLLYTGRFSGFCLVTSDSDFTRLAARIREQGLVVYGFGEREKTPKPFVAACDKFIYTDAIQVASESFSGMEEKAKKTDLDSRDRAKLLQQIRTAIDTYSSEENEGAPLGPVGHYLSRRIPEFDLRNYGYRKLSEFMESLGAFELSRKDNLVFIRRKPKGG